MEKSLYSIGDYVVVHNTSITSYDNDRHPPDDAEILAKIIQKTELNPPTIGIVVGMCHLQEGKRIRIKGYDRDGILCDIDQPKFECTKSHKVYLIRFGMLNKPVKVMFGDLERVDKLPAKYKFPMLFSKVWTKEDKLITSKASENWPRNNSGEWTKTGQEKNFVLIGKM